jgi:hypothetical protein
MATYTLSPPLPASGTDLVVGDAGQRGTSWVLIGTLAESGALRKLKLDISAEHVVAMLGKRGTGKSYTLGVLLEGLAVSQAASAIGSAAGSRATLVYDMLDIFWSSALPLAAGGPAELERQFARLGRNPIAAPRLSIDVWVPAGFEQPDVDLPATQHFRLNASEMSAEDWCVLFDFDLFGEPRGMLVDELVRKSATTGWTDPSGTVHQPNASYSLKDLLECLAGDAAIATSYTDATIRAVVQRLSAAALNPLFQGTPTPLPQLLQPGRAAVMMLGRAPESTKQLIAAFITRQIIRERQLASFAQKRLDLAANLPLSERAALEGQVRNSIPRTWLLIDEAQVLVPAGARTVCAEALIKYAKEGRNFGLSMAITTQQPSAVSERLMSQVETLFIHQLTARADLDVAVRNVKSPEPDDITINGDRASMIDAIRSLEQGVAMFSCANGGSIMPRCTVVRVRPRVTAHGGYEA